MGRGVFDLEQNEAALAACAGLGVRVGSDGVLVLRRELRREGRGRVLINGLVSSQALLGFIGNRLVAIQSPRTSSVQLARPAFTREFLDAALGLDGELAAVRSGGGARAAAAALAAGGGARSTSRAGSRRSGATSTANWWKCVAKAKRNSSTRTRGGTERAWAAGAAGRALQDPSDGQPAADALLGSADGPGAARADECAARRGPAPGAGCRGGGRRGCRGPASVR
ncbi:MAG: hypothetical protein IPH86_06270 [bacterium]|nr:hypothetical protein [bacterium]